MTGIAARASRVVLLRRRFVNRESHAFFYRGEFEKNTIYTVDMMKSSSQVPIIEESLPQSRSVRWGGRGSEFEESLPQNWVVWQKGRGSKGRHLGAEWNDMALESWVKVMGSEDLFESYQAKNDHDKEGWCGEQEDQRISGRILMWPWYVIPPPHHKNGARWSFFSSAKWEAPPTKPFHRNEPSTPK